MLSHQNRMSALEVSDCDGQADCFVYLQIALMCELQIVISKQLAVVHWSCAYVAFVLVDWPLPGAPVHRRLCLRIEIGYIKHNNNTSRALHTQIA